MTITLSCGHQSLDFPNDAIDVEYEEEYIDRYDGCAVECTVYATYCTDCANEGIVNGTCRLVSHEEEANINSNTGTTP